MARSHLKVYFDFDERTEELNDIEKGRLLLAMLRYAAEGQKPDLKGNERFCFPGFKRDIDRDIASYASKVENGNKGGRPAKNKPNETENNLTKPNETENNLNLKNKNEEEERRMKNEEEDVDSTQARITTTAAADAPVPFGAELSDGEILASLMQTNMIEDACRDWGLPCNPGNMVKARDLAQKYSIQWLMEAIKRAGNGKAQTWAYVEGILRSFERNGGPDKPGQTGRVVQPPEKSVSAQRYAQREYTENELMAVGDDLIAEARAMRGAG